MSGFMGLLQNQLTPMETPEPENEPPSKRRKTRKGTRSCWECKKRKERCIFIKDEVTCVSCQKRSTACIGQDLPDESHLKTSKSHATGDLRRVEDLLEQVLDRLDAGRNDDRREANRDNAEKHTEKRERAHLGETQPVRSYSTHDATRASSHGGHNALPVTQPPLKCQDKVNHQPPDISQILLAALPSHHDAEVICRATRRYQMSDIMICPYDEYESDGQALSAELLDYPPPTAPPAIIAKHLLRFAIHLQQRFRPGLHEENKELSAPIPELIVSYADAAAQFLAQDRLLGSIESLECMILQAIYECSRGSMRLSWMLVRRAVSLAQMNGLHLPETRRSRGLSDAKAPFGQRKMWIRLNYYDRFGSLLLALPMAVEDNRKVLGSDVVDDTPLSKLERMHCAVLGDLVRRNQADLPLPCFDMTKALDQKLQEIATIMPSSWWMMPLLTSDRSSTSSFREDMRRLTLQMVHSNLVLQVHLPYLLQPSSTSDYTLSRIACVDSAREILVRFIMCRSLNHDDLVCRVSDFIAFTAAVTLTLAYLSRHHQCLATSAWPVHHRHGDLGMIHRVEEIMREDQPFGFDSQAVHMADILHQLLRMEAKAAEGHKVVVKHINTTSARMEQDQVQGLLSVPVPYFGTIVIEPEATSAQAVAARPSMSMHPRNGITYRLAESLEMPDTSLSAPVNSGLVVSDPSTFSNAGAPSADLRAMTQSGDLINNDAMPGMFPPADDWVLQGIDTTLFSSLFGQIGGDWILNA